MSMRVPTTNICQRQTPTASALVCSVNVSLHLAILADPPRQSQPQALTNLTISNAAVHSALLLLPMLQDCWAPLPQDRPSMEQVIARLEAIKASGAFAQLPGGGSGGCCAIS